MVALCWLQVVSASVARLDRCYECLAGAAIYTSTAAQERHLRSTIESYFLHDDDTQQQCDAAAAMHADDEPDGSDGQAAAPVAGQALLPWGAPHPVLQPSQESLMRQLRAAVHGAAARVRDLGPDKFSGLSLARMVCGLSSPAIPHSYWKGCSEFGRMKAYDFRQLASAAEQVVQAFWAAESSTRLRALG